MTRGKSTNEGTDGDAIDIYQELGCKLLKSMMIYSHYLRKENLGSSSVSLKMMQEAKLSSQEGLQAKWRVAELAQQVLAATMDPDLSLLIDSLQFHFCSCLKIAVDLRIGEFIPKDGSVGSWDLASAVGAEQSLLVRIMRILMIKNVFAEPQSGFYTHTAVSWAMQAPHMRDLLLHRLDDSFQSACRLPDALRMNGYRNPIPGDVTGFNLAFDFKGNFWDYVDGSKSERGARFDRAMKAVNVNRLADIPQLYPFDRLVDDGGLIVDVGGGLGHVSREILTHNPQAGLRCVVQDLHVDPVINDTNGQTHCRPEKNGSDLAITMQHHNFLDPQPIKGAAAYFFRHIFHDWSDSDCITILKQTVSAMDWQRSRILICDQLIQDPSPSTPSILYDIDMMALFGGKERSLPDIEGLIKAASERLYISQLNTLPTTSTNIIELKLAPERN